jgi:hypothetical protein
MQQEKETQEDKKGSCPPVLPPNLTESPPNPPTKKLVSKEDKNIKAELELVIPKGTVIIEDTEPTKKNFG